MTDQLKNIMMQDQRLKRDDHMLQDPEEFRSFCELLKSEGARSYLEIGSWSGGSIQMVAEYLPKGSRIVSIDLAVNMRKHETLRRVLVSLERQGYWTMLCSARSDEPRAIDTARIFGPYDAVFIDGGHTYEIVTHDWENYGHLGRIIGFHDIATDSWKHGVAKFWNELKTQHRHVEFISEATKQQTIGYGIGVIWR